MDTEHRIDLDDVLRNITSAEILSFSLPLLRKALVIDTRPDPIEGPLVRILPHVRNREERFRSIWRLRPRLSTPESIAVVPWPRPVGGLERLGILDAVMARFAQEGHVQAVQDTRRAYEELLDLERLELRKALSGQDYHTLWETKRSKR